MTLPIIRRLFIKIIVSIVIKIIASIYKPITNWLDKIHYNRVIKPLRKQTIKAIEDLKQIHLKYYPTLEIYKEKYEFCASNPFIIELKSLVSSHKMEANIYCFLSKKLSLFDNIGFDGYRYHLFYKQYENKYNFMISEIKKGKHDKDIVYLD